MPIIKRCVLRQKEVYKHIDLSSQYYLSKGWLTLRKSYYIEHPICEECLKKGIVKPAEHIHHKKPFLRGKTEEERWELLLDEDNLLSLCLECHLLKHNKKLIDDKTKELYKELMNYKKTSGNDIQMIKL